jgi:hypothetical protein
MHRGGFSCPPALVGGSHGKSVFQIRRGFVVFENAGGDTGATEKAHGQDGTDRGFPLRRAALGSARSCFSPASYKKLTSPPPGVYTAPELLGIAT